MAIAVLGIADRSATYYVAERLIAHGMRPDAIILDTRPSSAKDIQIWAQRTGDRLPLHPLAELDLAIISVQRHDGDEIAELLSHFDLAVSAATRSIYSIPVLSAPRLGIINVHPGELPNYRGCTCVEWAIYNDDPINNTVHFVTEGIDEGPIVMREAYSFPKRASYVDVRVQVLRSGYDLIARAAKEILAHNITPADAEAQRGGTYYRPIPPDKMQSVVAKLAAGTYRYQDGA
jgi:methionyl-tRNA formyltransferase